MSRRRGIKTYHPHNIATIIYAVFALGMIALFAMPFIQPMFTFASAGEEALVFTGVDFVKVGLCQYLPTLKGPLQEAFVAYFNEANPDNQLLQIIIKFHGIVELVIVGVMALVAIFALVEFILAALLLIIGKSNKPKNIKTFAWLMFWFYALSLGLLFMYFFFYQQIAAFAEVEIKINFVIMTFVYLGAMFVVAIILTIINSAYFKDRVAIGRNDKLETYTIADTSDQNGTNPNNGGVQIQTRNPVNPNGIITVGESAYAKNVEITSATIPEGIMSLGSSAFANCVNMNTVNLPESIREIGFNCFFNTPKLTNIIYNGTVERWKIIKRGSNWLMKSGTRTVQCTDGKINVNPRH